MLNQVLAITLHSVKLNNFRRVFFSENHVGPIEKCAWLVAGAIFPKDKTPARLLPCGGIPVIVRDGLKPQIHPFFLWHS
jgi:hypothetical protein